ncbi:MAG: hypothetical protein KDC49_01460 [Saprospiraceae bacterium]|nr:hypothetical protein [Saprospiraceae bacterium]
MKHTFKFIFAALMLIAACKSDQNAEMPASTEPVFDWNNATVYFLLTDRFQNGDQGNDFQVVEGQEAAPFRGFMGGDLQGVTQKIEEGYFTDLGVDAIWTTPVVQNIDGFVDEGTGKSYGFHGYWTKDWTVIEPKLGGEEAFRKFVDAAHSKGIKVIVDVVLNHTGPVTELDPVWPKEWVRTEPQCVYKDEETTVSCTLVKNLPDIRTEDDSTEVTLPEGLVAKWKEEGRYDQEMAELDAFFASTGYPRTPTNYIIKWLTDFVTEFGVDGFRVDTAKHVEASVWKKLWEQAKLAFERYKKQHPETRYDGSEFYMVGEVYGYGAGGGQMYDYGDSKVNFFDNGFNSLINFGYKYDANETMQAFHEKYDSILSGDLNGKYILNYLSSHDDGSPWDKDRSKTYEAANRLLLSQGGAQIYYGDETGRSLTVAAEGDAVLRSPMNWEDITSRDSTKMLLEHWQKIGKFRHLHPAVGAGKHQTLSAEPYVFSRTYAASEDIVVVGLGLAKGAKTLPVDATIADGTVLKDHYSQTTAKVKNGKIEIDTPFDLVLLSK